MTCDGEWWLEHFLNSGLNKQNGMLQDATQYIYHMYDTYIGVYIYIYIYIYLNMYNMYTGIYIYTSIKH